MGQMTLLITGAAGYLGREIVAQARAAGHSVIASLRGPKVPADWSNDDGITPLIGDLSQSFEALNAAAHGADCTIHCAASLSGDSAAQAKDTDAATGTLLDALRAEAKLVHVSSIAIYDFAACPPGSVISEASPFEAAPEQRDAYAQAKIAQEAQVQAAADQKGFGLTILRPGAIFGPGRLWNAHLGRVIGPILLRFGNRGEIPLVHLAHCASACLNAAERPPMGPVNLLDEDLPSRARFLAALDSKPKLVIPLSDALLAPVLSNATRAARYGPLKFDTTRMRSELGVAPTASFEALMRDAQGGAS